MYLPQEQKQNTFSMNTPDPAGHWLLQLARPDEAINPFQYHGGVLVSRDYELERQARRSAISRTAWALWNDARCRLDLFLSRQVPRRAVDPPVLPDPTA